MAVGVPGAALAWWQGSPVFITATVEEEFPLAYAADVPDGMTREEVEATMATMAKMDSPLEEPMTKGMAEAKAVKAGQFKDFGSHKGEGTVTIYTLSDGTSVLRLESFKVTNGPDLRVILTPHSDPQKSLHVKQAGYIELGKLKGNVGNQNYQDTGRR